MTTALEKRAEIAPASSSCKLVAASFAALRDDFSDKFVDAFKQY